MSMMSFNILSEDVFADRFPLVTNPFDDNASWDGCLFETFGPELDFVLAQPREYVWTLVDCDSTVVVTSGRCWGNRIGYLVSTVPVPPGHSYEVLLGEVQP